MKITIINPNTTGEMTEDICESAHYFSRPDTEINCVNPENGPVTIG
jgi:Asp/Glu/hydantoin racemase